MFKKKKKTGCETPEFRKPTLPPPPTNGTNAVKPKKPCPYETPCGWCTRWEKKCDKKIGRDKNQGNPLLEVETIKPVWREPRITIVP